MLEAYFRRCILAKHRHMSNVLAERFLSRVPALAHDVVRGHTSHRRTRDEAGTQTATRVALWIEGLDQRLMARREGGVAGGHDRRLTMRATPLSVKRLSI